MHSRHPTLVGVITIFIVRGWGRCRRFLFPLGTAAEVEPNTQPATYDRNEYGYSEKDGHGNPPAYITAVDGITTANVLVEFIGETPHVTFGLEDNGGSKVLRVATVLVVFPILLKDTRSNSIRHALLFQATVFPEVDVVAIGRGVDVGLSQMTIIRCLRGILCLQDLGAAQAIDEKEYKRAKA